VVGNCTSPTPGFQSLLERFGFASQPPTKIADRTTRLIIKLAKLYRITHNPFKRPHPADKMVDRYQNAREFEQLVVCRCK
jgi:hypothetical protein